MRFGDLQLTAEQCSKPLLLDVFWVGYTAEICRIISGIITIHDRNAILDHSVECNNIR